MSPAPAHSTIIHSSLVQNRTFSHFRTKKTFPPKKKYPFFYCVIPDQYEERDLRPEVSTTSGSGCFAMAHTDRQTDKHTDMATL